jgi:uncharacterized MAPEG superfamily protein
MPTELRLLAYSAILTWLMVVVASALKASWSLPVMFGNRADVPAPTPLAARADRAARNMPENLLLFVAVVLATAGAREHDRIVLGARSFFWARVADWPVYLAGITYVRTALWFAGVVGMGIMLTAAL